MMVELLSEDAHTLFRDLVAAGGRPLDGSRPPALRELVDRGLAWESAEPVPMVYPVSPVAAMRRLLSNEQQHVIHAHRRIIEQYAELESLERRNQPAGVELLATAEAVALMTAELTSGVRQESRSVCAPSAEDLPAPARRLPATGARHRRLIAVALLADPGARGRIEGAERAGYEHRAVVDLPAPMVVTEDAALVWLAPAAQSAALLIRGGALVDSLARLFDLLWRHAVPLATAADATADGPTPVQTQILRLASAGLKDEAIARSLGRSVRWVRRHFELLEERLGATNRLTLGIAAARRGWV